MAVERRGGVLWGEFKLLVGDSCGSWPPSEVVLAVEKYTSDRRLSWYPKNSQHAKARQLTM
jgi:hypothetical protein